tara:strand:- start:818 stop:958 length:141 start_codon:yes stop_codon:yes gene_type:complete
MVYFSFKKKLVLPEKYFSFNKKLSKHNQGNIKANTLKSLKLKIIIN